MRQSPNYRFAFALITLLFFVIGFITVLVDSLIPRLKELFELTYFQAGLVQFAFFGAYFLLSIPSSYILTKIGYKGGIIAGLLTIATGCALFYPAAEYRIFGIFILGYFTLAGGMTLLQVAINPYVAVLGEAKTASSRLTLAQAFNSLGTAIAPAIGAMFILSDTIKSKADIESLGAEARSVYLSAEAAAVQTPFVVIAGCIILVGLALLFIQLPKLMSEEKGGSYLDLLKHPNLLLGALGIFCYVGAEVAIGSYAVSYFLDMDLAATVKGSSWMRSIADTFLNGKIDQVDAKSVVGIFVTFYWTGAMIGRFIGVYLNKRFHPGRVVTTFAISAFSLAFISMFSNGFVAMWSLLAIGLFNSIMFPTIFTLAIGKLGHLVPKGSGILCMAIVGGALVPPLFGFLADIGGFKVALWAVIICYSYIAFYGYYNSKQHSSKLMTTD